jgi:UDP-glucuronate decarboxylase
MAIGKTSMESLVTAHDVTAIDTKFICDKAQTEFTRMGGKRLLITGGAGFLGYYLIQSLLAWNSAATGNNKIHITVYDNYIRGIPDWLNSLRNDENLSLVKHDITHPLPKNAGRFDYIIHAASIASPMYYRKYPIETMDANVNGLRYLLEYGVEMKKQGDPIKGFLFYSTSEIYGDPTPGNIPTPETYRGNVSCTGPRACYDESKRYGETLCVNFAQQFGLPITVARPFNNYGPGLKITDRRVIPDFVRNILNGEDIVMYSDGSPTRTFCYIADAIVGYYKILINGKQGDAYNIGVPSPEISMRELAEKLVDIGREIVGYNGTILYRTSNDGHYLTDNPNRRCPDISKAASELGFAPEIDIDDGLRRTFIWYTGNKEAVEA